MQFKKCLNFPAVFAHSILEEEMIYMDWFLGNLSHVPANMPVLQSRVETNSSLKCPALRFSCKVNQ